jgi:hypothetical protein
MYYSIYSIYTISHLAMDLTIHKAFASEASLMYLWSLIVLVDTSSPF